MEDLPPRVPDGTRVTKRSCANCTRGTDVVWYEIAGGGHRWPPRQAERPGLEQAVQRAFGTSSQDLDTTQAPWAFFEAHPRR